MNTDAPVATPAPVRLSLAEAARRAAALPVPVDGDGVEVAAFGSSI